MIFRSDINLLRALAVIGVVLFHFKVPGFGGGFFGVDVFFVISGYLMMSIVRGRLDSGRFSLIQFFADRVRRIVPLLLLVVGSLLALGWFFLPFPDYEMLAKHAAKSLMFSSNFTFLKEAGYFDVASHEKWLLHTWSLAVEWQFYFLFPFLMVVLWASVSSQRGRQAAILAITIISFLVCIYFYDVDESWAFYMLPARAWEMLLGGCILFLPAFTSKRYKLFAYYCGLALILASFVSFDVTHVWSGWGALMPVLGAALVIWASCTESWASNLAVLSGIGKSSYSIYLWHWPIYVASVYFSIQSTDPAVMALLLAACVVIGWVSYQFFELPSSSLLRQIPTGRLLFGVLSVALIIGTFASVLQHNKGVPGRLSDGVEFAYAASLKRPERVNECHVGAPAKVPGCVRGGAVVGAIVVGDSHAETIVTAVASAMNNGRLGVKDWTYASCPTVFGVRIKGNYPLHCANFLAQMKSELQAYPGVPIFVLNRYASYILGPNDVGREKEFGRPGIYFDDVRKDADPDLTLQYERHFVDTVCKLAEKNPVYLVRPVPELKYDVPRFMGRSLQSGSPRRVFVRLSEYRQRNRLAIKAQDSAVAKCGAHVVDLTPFLCDGRACWGDVGGIPVYYDDDHLNEDGAKLISPVFQAAFSPQQAH